LLVKLFKPLVSARVLRAGMGPHGGYRLGKPPPKITVLEVIEAVDGPIRGQATPPEEARGTDLDAKLDAVCDQAANLIKKQLGKVRGGYFSSNLLRKINKGPYVTGRYTLMSRRVTW